jgi:phosphohistidine swiveling domain-containing protein
LDELLHPIIDPASEKNAEAFPFRSCRPGRAARAARSSSPRPTPWNGRSEGQDVILVREETNPEDVEGMRAAEGILTARGGMTSHAALVARGWGKCCIVGAGDMKIDLAAKTMSRRRRSEAQGRRLITLNGTKGLVYAGALEMMDATENPALPGVHEAGRQVPHDGRPHQRRHAGGRQGRPQASAPKASACSAPSTCSTARAPTSRCSAAQDDPQQHPRERKAGRWTSCSPS